jgi:hypothetical protein
MSEAIQLDLFVPRDERKVSYWRHELLDGMCDAFKWRHRRYSSAWGMAIGCAMFARLLTNAGEMSQRELNRWERFEERLNRWEAMP